MSENEKDAKYMLENMVGNVIMVMGKGREWGKRWCEANIVRNHVGDLVFKANGNEVGRLARNHSIIVQDDEWRTAVGTDGDCSYYENYVSRGVNAYGG